MCISYRFSAEMFPDILMEEQSALASRDSACLSSIEERAETALREAFVRLDREFCSLCTRDGRDWDCGSTALVALIVDDVVSLANLGDCRGVVCRLVSDDNGTEVEDGWEALDSQDDDNFCDRANGWGNGRLPSRGKLIWKELTSTHSPLFEEERARIDRANGWIIHETEIPISQLHRMDIFDKDVVEIVKRCFADRMKQHRSDPVRQIQIARTCGDLAVSRAIGDRDFKAAYNIPSKKSTIDETEQLGTSWEGPLVFIYPDGHSGRFKGDIVSNVPDIQFFKVRKEPTILLMACDGLWDVMDGDDAVRIATDLLLDKKLSAKDGAARLTELAQHLGSSDNITVILIRFYWEESNE
jgi:serine/threonine protein phosphatase PrpC